MTRTEMLAIVRRLDARADALLLTGANEFDVFLGMTDLMPDFKALLDGPYRHEIDALAARFPAFHRYAAILSNIATGFADGSIKAPPKN